MLTISSLTFFSCSSDDDTVLSKEEILVQNSPWTFNHYEMINIIDAGNSDFTQTDIESDINQVVSGTILIFNSDRTGSTFTPGEGTDTWDWEILNDADLKISYDGTTDSDTFENLSITSSQLIIEAESVSFDEVALFEVLHYGKYFYE